VGGHGGQWKAAEMVTRNFWWPGVTREVKWYVEEYDVYQCNKNQIQPLAGKLMPNLIPEKACVKTQVVVAITLTQISLYIRVNKENLLKSSLVSCTLLIHT